MLAIEYKTKSGLYVSCDVRPTNKGYGDAGASHYKRSLKGFTASSSNAREDIDQHNDSIRQRARMLYMASPLATSAIRSTRTNVVGFGLRLKCRINRDMLGMGTEAANHWERNTESEFELWAGKKQACDATGVNDFYSLQQLALVSWLLSGDCFGLIKHYPATPNLPYSLRLHLIEADRVSTPLINGETFTYLTESKAENGNKIYDGVEVDSNGAIAAYYIRNTYPSTINLEKTEWNRIKVYGKETGLPNILQIMDSERPEQYRGVSYLAQIIEPLLQLRRYTESELNAAVLESFFTAFVLTNSTTTEDMPFNSTNPDDQVSQDPSDYEMGMGTINILKNGEDIKFADPKRPTSGFPAFCRSICEQMGAALEIPADLLLKAFNASYSASRAALLEAWKAFKMRRSWFTSDFCQPVYEIWLSEAVARGRVSAPGFFTNPLIRAAWLGAEWIGPSQGQLDPIKEITAEILAISEGITTREQATVKLNGGSWDTNVDQLAQENQRLSAAGTQSLEVSAQLGKGIKQTLLESFREGEKHD